MQTSLSVQLLLVCRVHCILDWQICNLDQWFEHQNIYDDTLLHTKIEQQSGQICLLLDLLLTILENNQLKQWCDNIHLFLKVADINSHLLHHSWWNRYCFKSAFGDFKSPCFWHCSYFLFEILYQKNLCAVFSYTEFLSLWEAIALECSEFLMPEWTSSIISIWQFVFDDNMFFVE